ncbi:hypothetical protein EVA_06230 [gut metagenome]|uniref:Uncharacterized protein n=1 Tax=gut metagenome TaxID=749906 RepID=J9GSN7_9ZZZZ
MVFCKRAVFFCPSIWSLTLPRINSLPSANATYSNGLVVTICAFAETDKMMPNRSIVILMIGDLIDSFSLFVKLYTLSDNIHDIDSFGQTCQFQLGRGPVHRQHCDSL